MNATVIFGCPGSGKTHDLKTRIEQAEADGINPEKMMVLSHTKIAAKEITKRAPKVRASTIHSLAFQILNMSREQVVSDTVLTEFIKWVKIDDRFTDDYLSLYQLAQNTGSDPSDIYHNSFRPGTHYNFKYFYESYINWKEAHGFMDFNDMLLHLLKDEADRAGDITHLYVDEAQDLSTLQWGVIDKLVAMYGIEELTITGDPDQAIYVWGGAQHRGMELAAERYGAQRVEMGRSFRVPYLPGQLAYGVIQRTRGYEREPFLCTSEPGHVHHFMNPNGLDFHGDDVMILYRTHYSGKDVEDELVHRMLPYTKTGMKGPCDNRHGNLVRTLRRLQEGNDLSHMEISKLRGGASPWGRGRLAEGDFGALAKCAPSKALDLPPQLCQYYDSVNMADSGKIKISTIHGSKGAEANRVILYTGTTNRVQQEMMLNPDNEYRVWYVGATRTKSTLDVWHGTGGFKI